MNTHSLRFRLMRWYALWLTVAFAATGVLLYFGLRHYLERNLTASQTLRANRIVSLVRRTGNGQGLADEINASFAPEASSRFIRITKPDGTVLYQSGPPGDLSFSPAQMPAPLRHPGVRKAELADGAEVILVTVAAGPDWLVETGESFAPALTELRRLLATLGLGFVVVAVVSLGGGFLLVRRALRPVEEIIRSAERITSQNLGERLPVPATGDEFAHLSQALNRMIERLDDAFQHNRRFLADASHELRTPLTILRGELEVMVRRDGLGPDQRSAVDNLLEEVRRLARIVENLFALSRLDAGQAQTEVTQFDFAKLTATTAEQMCLLAEDKHLAITCETPAPVFVAGDRARLKQVIVNLLDNAIKYTPDGGAVKLSVTARNGEAVCEVADNGMGIPAEAVPHVFDRFFRVDKARTRELGGAGIGLSIVKAICTAHHGRVEVESTEGRGSRFRVHLPLVASAPPA